MAHVGILNLNKPAGWTSRDVVNRIDRLCRPARAGHAGTLDPLATGVLVICVGQATRLIQYVQQMRKVYCATFLLGRASVTDDTDSQVALIDDAPVPSRAAVEHALPQFLGSIPQRPPAHSAIKVGGRRAYKLARQGVAVELAPRTVVVHNIHLAHYEYPELRLRIECGRGTYVRALGRDLAAALSTTAVMSGLERSAVGGFRVEDSVRPDELTSENLSGHLQPALSAVRDMPRVVLNDAQLADIRHGRPAVVSVPTAGSSVDANAEWAAVDAAGQLMAILRQRHPYEFWPTKNFA
jgi:tRNA pseudouridine55 synthase